MLAAKAAGDQVTMDRLAGDEDIPDEAVGFHAQQAVEKFLKATLAAGGVEPPRTHDLAYLLSLINESGMAPPPAAADLKALVPWAREFRYEEPLGATLDRTRTVEIVHGVREWAAQHLSEGTEL